MRSSVYEIAAGSSKGWLAIKLRTDEGDVRVSCYSPSGSSTSPYGASSDGRRRIVDTVGSRRLDGVRQRRPSHPLVDRHPLPVSPG